VRKDGERGEVGRRWRESEGWEEVEESKQMRGGEEG